MSRPTFPRLCRNALTLCTLAALMLAGSLPALAADPPPNDLFDGAKEILALPYSDAMSTVDATATEPGACFNWPTATVWYKYTAAQDARLKLITSSSTYWTQVDVYAGPPDSFGTAVVSCSGPDVEFQATAGTTYYFMIGGYYAGGDLVLELKALLPPPNDAFDHATSISALPFADTADMTVATFDGPMGCLYWAMATVWYAYTPPTTMTLSAWASGGMYTPQIEVFRMVNGELQSGGCGSSLQLRVRGGTEYYFRVGASNDSGAVSFSLDSIPPPVNDAIENAIVIGALPFAHTVDVSAATADPSDPAACGPGGPSIWYAFTPAADVPVHVYVFGNYVAVFKGSPGSLEKITCGDMGVVFDAVGGTQYYILMSSPYSMGTQTITVHEGLALKVTPDAAGTFDTRTGFATLGGVVTCNRASRFSLSIELRQNIGRIFTVKSNASASELSCSPAAPARWSFTFVPESGKFAASSATAISSGYGYTSDGQDGANDTISGTASVALRRAPK